MYVDVAVDIYILEIRLKWWHMGAMDFQINGNWPIYSKYCSQ